MESFLYLTFHSGCKEYEDLKLQRERKKENKKRMVISLIFLFNIYQNKPKRNWKTSLLVPKQNLLKCLQ